MKNKSAKLDEDFRDQVREVDEGIQANLLQGRAVRLIQCRIWRIIARNGIETPMKRYSHPAQHSKPSNKKPKISWSLRIIN
jgi:hypothetical protein